MTDEQPLNRAQRRAIRIQKRQQRIDRRTARAERIAKRKVEQLKMGGEMPSRIEWPPSIDQLDTFSVARVKLDAHPLRDIWRGSAGFLVCGGPSLKTYDLERLKDRGIVSLGINNAAGFAHCRAMTFSDPAEKFHYGIFMDPTIMKIVPVSKLKNRVRARLPDGSFRWTRFNVEDCPNVFGFERPVDWQPDTFLTRNGATWGNNKDAAAKNGRPKILFTFFLGIRLLHYLGCRRIYMIGVDFRMDKETAETTNYAWGDRRGAAVVGGNNNHYRVASFMLRELRPIIEGQGLQIFNCNQQSGLTVFPFIPFEQAIQDCRGAVPPEPFDLDGYYDKSMGHADANQSEQAE